MVFTKRSQSFALGWFGVSAQLLGVEDDVEEKQAGGGEDDVVTEEHFDPEGGVAVAGEDVAGGLDHGEQSGNEDGKENQREKEFAIAAADGERGEEDSVDDQGPGAERKNEGQLPGWPCNVKVVEDEEEGREDDLDDGDEEKVGDGFGEEEFCARRRDHALRVHDLVADFAGPGLIEGVTEANMVATQRTPPAICCENAPRGSKAMEKSTTTRPEKKIMEIMASRVRHSMRRSLARCVKRARVMLGPPGMGNDIGFPRL